MIRLNKKTIVIPNGFVIQLNKSYIWKGESESRFFKHQWNCMCTVITIADDSSSFSIISDDDNKLYTITESFINGSCLTFQRLTWLERIIRHLPYPFH
jgi:hypothetical protein